MKRLTPELSNLIIRNLLRDARIALATLELNLKASQVPGLHHESTHDEVWALENTRAPQVF